MTDSNIPLINSCSGNKNSKTKRECTCYWCISDEDKFNIDKFYKEDLIGKIQKKDSQIKELKELLREGEWGTDRSDSICIICFSNKDERHTSDCRLKKALDGE